MEEGDARKARLAACKFNPFTLLPHSQEKYLYLSNFDIQHWYTSMQHHTIPTRVISITYEDGVAMRRSFDAKAERTGEGVEPLTEGDVLLISKLEERIQNIIDDLSPDQGIYKNSNSIHKY